MSEVIVGRKGGSKGGGSSGSARAAVEAPDSLRSRQHVRMLHAICEGEVEGLVGGWKGITFDDVPLQSADGGINFPSVGVDVRNGTQWQSYVPMTGLEAEQSVGVELRWNTTIERAITDTDVDAVRVTISVSQLTQQNTANGDITDTAVQFAIVGRLGSGAWYPLCGAQTISGKTMSRTQFSYFVRLPPSGGLPRYIGVYRITPDSTSSALQNRTFFDSYTLLWEEKLRYPNTMVVGLSLMLNSSPASRAWRSWFAV